MNKLRFFSLLLFLAILFIGCSENEQIRVVKLEPTQKEKLNLGEVVNVISLEKTGESLLKQINKAFIDNKNNRIFILSDFNLYVFDLQGKFITKLTKGKGPGEITMVLSFSVKTDKKLLQILDLGNTILTTDYNGKLVSKINLNDFYSFDIQSLNDNYAFLLRNYVGKSEKNFVGLYNIANNQVEKKYITADESLYSSITYVSSNNFQISNKRQFFYSPNIFALFEFKDSRFQKIIEFDLGNKKIPDNIIATFKEKRQNFDNEELQKNYIPFLNYIFYFNGYYIVVAGNSEKSCYAIDENDFSKVYLNGQLSSYFNLPEINSLKHPCGYDNGYLILSCIPVELFENEPELTSKTINVGVNKIDVNFDDNPFLILLE